MKKSRIAFLKTPVQTLLALLFIMLLTLTGCQSASEATVDISSNDSALVPEKETLTISAAASLTEALTEIKTLYETKYPEKTLLLNFASSGSLEQQIEQGADVDVFLSASPKYMDLLKEKSLILDDNVTQLLKNEIVLVSNVNSSLKNVDFNTLESTQYDKIGIGEPSSVPAGQYAEEILTHLDIKENVYTHAVFAKDVKEVLTWVETDNVDLGIVYSTDAINSDHVKILCSAPADTHKAIIYPVAIIKTTQNPDASSHFLNFLGEEDAMSIFLKHGFLAAE